MEVKKDIRKLDVIDRAIEVAAKAHRNHFRKNPEIPFIAHPVSVGLILMREGYPDYLVAAAILHDTVEDTEMTIEEVRDEFGDQIGDVVAGVSVPDEVEPWEESKKHTHDLIRNASADVRLVENADKLHNLMNLARDLEVDGEEVWTRFARGKEKIAWHYRECASILLERADDERQKKLAGQLMDLVTEVFNDV